MLTRAKRQQQQWMIKIEQVFNCVIPYVHDVDDRNSISLVCRRLYELDGITRKHVTVHVLYCPNPSRVSQRFPFVDSLTLKGFPFKHYIYQKRYRPRNRITPWIKEIAVTFTCLKELQIHGLIVYAEDLKSLAISRGKDIRVLKINKSCGGLWEDGLVHVARYCNQLRSLSLEGDGIGINNEEHGKWLHELAIHNTVLESFHCRFDDDRFDVQDLTILARKCSKSLVSLTLLGDAFRHAVKLEDFSVAYNGKGMDYSGFQLPPNVCCFGISDFPVTALRSLLPLASQIKELNLKREKSVRNCVCFLIERCSNLEILYTDDPCGDRGLKVIGKFCKRLHKLTYTRHVTGKGLIALAHGCNNLEYIKVRKLIDISNDAMECVGTRLKNLRHFSVNIYAKTIPLENGIRAMLMGCNKLERLDIILRHGGLTDVGLEYIGKYGHNLKYLSVECIGESDAGLMELSKGCPRLRTLRLKNCPFSEQAVSTLVLKMNSLRYVCVVSGYRTVSELTRPDFEL